MSGTLKVNIINSTDGCGLLSYHPNDWTGVNSTQWSLGTVNSQGVIRSNSSNLLHYRVGENTSYIIWDAANDGSGSGLDADLLDGKHANAFVDRSSSHGSNVLTILQALQPSLADSEGHAVRLEHGKHSYGFGWFLKGYSYEKAYGGWFISNYGTPWWVGVDNGSWKSDKIALASDIPSITKSVVMSALNTSGKNTFTQYCDFTAGAGNSGSDIRFKKNITPLPNILNNLRSIDIFSYIWNKENERAFDTFGVNADKLLEHSIFKKIVHERPDEDKTKFVDYDRIGVLALKGLQEEVEIREKKIQELENRLKKLEEKLGLK